MPVGDCLLLRGLGLRLPGVTTPADLVRQLTGAVPPSRTVLRFEAPHTDLGPVERWINGPVEPRMPARITVRGLRALPRESLLALAAATDAETAAAAAEAADAEAAAAGAETVAVGTGPAAVAPAAVVWASSSAGLVEYATICVEAAVLDPGLTSPILGPASAFNGPAATVSIRLGLTGPNETLTGGTTAGMSALVEAGRVIADGDADRALVGGSAMVSRWSLPGVPAGADPAEGAACLAVRPARDDGPGIRLRPFRRVTLDRHQFAAGLDELVRGAPGPIIVSAADSDLVDALAGRNTARAPGGGEFGPVWHVERALGDFGAAGGLIAVVCAVAYCATAPAPTTVLALAVEPSGNAAIMEVSSWRAVTSSSG